MTVEARQNIPAPFLGPIFASDFELDIGSGYNYDHAHNSNDAIHGVEQHKAIDFGAPIGTPIYAPADGLALATYSEFLLGEKDDVNAFIPRRYKGKKVYFGSGLIIQIWHGRGRYTQYAHLHKVSPNIPYYKPIVDKDSGDLRPAHLRDVVSEYGKGTKATKVKRGELIGYTGVTGIGWGKRCYEDWSTGKKYTYYDDPHLHFMVFGRRLSRSRNPVAIWDPFGIYGKAAQYPANKNEWHTLKNSLWLKQDDKT